MQAALGKLLTFHNNNQVLIKNCCYGNGLFTTCPPYWPPSWIFRKYYFKQNCSKFLLKLEENMCLQPQIGI